MVKTSSQLKYEARQQLKGRWIEIVTANLILIIVSSVLYSVIGVLGIVGTFLAMFVEAAFLAPLELGLASYCVRFANHESLNIKEIFEGFNRWPDAIILKIIVSLYTWLWTLLFIIPGIIKAYSYSMSSYILADNPHMKPIDALEWSKKITDGHKMTMFYIDLSFIGWSIVSLIVCGVGLIWLLPYIQVTDANLYLNLKQCHATYSHICENALSVKDYKDVEN